MKIPYFDLLSPAPICIRNVGSVISPTLREISTIGIDTYRYYTNIILMEPKAYYTLIGQKEYYESLSDDEKSQLNIFDLLVSTEQSAIVLQTVLNFFIKEDVLYSEENKVFLIQNDNILIGMISKEIYPQICDIICQRNYIKYTQEEDLSKVKSKKALEIMKKIRKGREEKAKHSKEDSNMELGNIISAVANKSLSLNIINIWDATIFQVWDCFSRLLNNNIYDIQSMRVATWGNKDNHFDVNAWFKRISDK